MRCRRKPSAYKGTPLDFGQVRGAAQRAALSTDTALGGIDIITSHSTLFLRRK
jgi:hypothetical protein